MTQDVFLVGRVITFGSVGSLKIGQYDEFLSLKIWRSRFSYLQIWKHHYFYPNYLILKTGDLKTADHKTAKSKCAFICWKPFSVNPKRVFASTTENQNSNGRLLKFWYLQSVLFFAAACSMRTTPRTKAMQTRR